MRREDEKVDTMLGRIMRTVGLAACCLLTLMVMIIVTVVGLFEIVHSGEPLERIGIFSRISNLFEGVREAQSNEVCLEGVMAEPTESYLEHALTRGKRKWTRYESSRKMLESMVAEMREEPGRAIYDGRATEMKIIRLSDGTEYDLENAYGLADMERMKEQVNAMAPEYQEEVIEQVSEHIRKEWGLHGYIGQR